MSKDIEYWENALKEAREQHQALCTVRDALDREREAVNSRIVQLEQVITSLTPLASENPHEKMNAFLIENATEIGLADAVREILKNSNKFMTPVYIRDALVESGYDLSPYSNPLASIHGVLKRMEQSENSEVESHTSGRGTMYRWKYVISPAPTMTQRARNMPPPIVSAPPVIRPPKVDEARRKAVLQSESKIEPPRIQRPTINPMLKGAEDAPVIRPALNTPRIPDLKGKK